MSRGRLPLGLVIGAPVLALLIGGAAGWFMRDEGSSGGPAATPVTVAGATLPAALDSVAPLRPLPPLPNPAIVDPAAIIGLDATTSGALEVPGDAALDLPLVAGGTAVVVDATKRAPIATVASPTPVPVGDAVAIDALAPVAPTESTLPAAESAATTAPAPPGTGEAFLDPCTTATTPCPGAPAVVLDPIASPANPLLAPLQVSMPMAGAEGFAALCDTVEGGNVPDAILTPATRPTVAVLVNQPSTLALTGTWADGTALAKTTMVTSPAHDAEWQRAWDDDHVQRNIIACVTLPLDDVRAHAGGGVAELRADVLAISATGRADVSGQVSLDIPTDGEDALFAERLTITDRGEQRRPDGVLYPTVHVHYALLADATMPAGSGLDPATLHVYDEHAFVEDADCSGWAVNQQGRNRTSGASYMVVNEQRTISGRVHDVIVVDGDVYLDPARPSGWQGHFCVRLTATDDPENPRAKVFTLALRGATARSPRTADYAVSVWLAGGSLPATTPVRVAWSTATGTPICGEGTVSTDPATAGRGTTCATSARFAPDGVQVAITANDDRGAPVLVLTARVPVNTAACNPDDPYAALADGCDHGYSQPIEMALAPSLGDGTVRIILQVNRTAEPGGLWQDPSHAWKFGPLTSFAF
ncbi:MAG: hypothetical protein WCC60_07090 [Ilumatobacteraceae bacterium]